MRRVNAVLFLLVIGIVGTSATPRVGAQVPESAGILGEAAFKDTIKRFIEEELTLYERR
jgi:hypothetical protein